MSISKIKVGEEEHFIVTSRTSTIALAASGWEEYNPNDYANVYVQDVIVPGATATSKVDIQPTAEQFIKLRAAGITLLPVNNDGTIRVFAFNNKPAIDYAMQVTFTELETRGITVGNVVTAPGGDSSQNDTNLLAGYGKDSIIQKYTGEVDETHYGNTSTGESAAIFGEANKNTANRALMAGKLNKNSGANHIVGGVYNETTEKATSGITVGYQNFNNHENAILGGCANENNAAHTILGGKFNEITEKGAHSIGGGLRNKANAENSIFNGQDNVIDAINGSAFGYGLKVEGLDGKVVIGRYNAPKSNTIFEVGNGTADKPSNAFEVYEDGSTNLSGAGGKVYKHYIQMVNISVPVAVVFTVYTSSAEQMTAEKLYEMFPTSQSYAVFCWSATEGKFNYIKFSNIGFNLSGRYYEYDGDEIPINDTVTEV